MPLSLSKQRLALIRFDLWNVDLQTLLQYVISSQRIVTRGRITDADFSREKLMWYRPVGSNAVGCSSRSDIVADFFGCVHRSSDSQCFSMDGTTPQISPSLFWMVWTPTSPKTASHSAQSFMQGSRTWPTDGHIDHATLSVATSRI